MAGTATAGHSTLGDAFAGLSSGVADTDGPAAASAGDAALGHGIGAASEQMGAGVRSLMGRCTVSRRRWTLPRAYAATDESAMPISR